MCVFTFCLCLILCPFLCLSASAPTCKPHASLMYLVFPQVPLFPNDRVYYHLQSFVLCILHTKPSGKKGMQLALLSLVSIVNLTTTNNNERLNTKKREEKQETIEMTNNGPGEQADDIIQFGTKYKK